MPIRIDDLNFEDKEQMLQVLEILSIYAQEDGGGNKDIADETKSALPELLKAFENKEILVAFENERPVGVAVCFGGFSTFRAMPTLNIHDLAVLPDQRGKGVGSALLEAVAARAKERGCCKVTLEVIASNEGAQRLYRRHEFDSPTTGAPTLFMERQL